MPDLTPEQQAAQAQEPAVPATPPPAAQEPPVANEPTTAQPVVPQATPAVPPSQGSPWSSDLATRFSDEATRSSVDTFLRDTVQPYVTQLEQSSKPAVDLLKDFTEKPDDTFLEVAEDLYGPEHAKAFKDYLDAIQDEPPEAQQTQEQATVPPEVQALIDEKRAADDKRAFDAEFDRIKTADPETKYDYDLFVPLVAQTDDFDAAVKLYKDKGYPQYVAWREAEAAKAAEEPTPPPPVLGAEGGQSAVPAQKEYTTVGEAIDDWASDLRASGQEVAPPVPST